MASINAEIFVLIHLLLELMFRTFCCVAVIVICFQKELTSIELPGFLHVQKTPVVFLIELSLGVLFLSRHGSIVSLASHHRCLTM